MDNNAISVATFDKLAEHYQEKYMDFDFYFETYDTFCDLVTKENAKIFEVACGPGNITRYLLNKRPDFKIEGTDLSPNMVKLAQQNNPTASFQVMDSRDVAKINKQFDAIICGFCFPYLSRLEIQQFIIDAKSLLKQGGILYLSTMEDDYSKSGLQASSTGDQVYIYYHQFDLIKDYLESNGFKVIKFKRLSFPVETGATPVTDLFVYAQL